MAELSFKDYASDQEVRWCPGCGDYSILKAVQRTLANIGAKPENTVFVSGIGCAARLPYYIEAYGFHTIHGAGAGHCHWRQTGQSRSGRLGCHRRRGRPLHRRQSLDAQPAAQRQPQHPSVQQRDLWVDEGAILATSRIGTTSPSSPGGSVDSPLHPCAFAVGAGATFIARGIDIDQKGLPVILAEAQRHQGAAFVEILQNCIVYNKDVFDSVANKKTAADHQIRVEHGHPLIYGKDRHRGLRLNPAKLRLEGFMIGEDGADGDVLVHDETNPTLALMLATMTPPLPTALGVIHRRPAECFDRAFWNSKSHSRRRKVESLLHQGNVLDRR